MPGYTRRQFLQGASASVLGASVLGACSFSRVELLAQSPLRTPEDLVTGRDNWYATLCQECPARCGVVVRVVEGRAIKVEGNPLYPLNQGKLCARGQAAVQRLYHPDRVSQLKVMVFHLPQEWVQRLYHPDPLFLPLRRDGPRGSGRFLPVSWKEALGEIAQNLRELRQKGQENTVLLLTSPLRGHLGFLVHQFTTAYGCQHLTQEVLEDTNLRVGVKQVFGLDTLPDWDIAQARFVLSFGADFLSTYLSPVRYSRGYGQFRRQNLRGTLVQVEPGFSLTAANADQWLPIHPGTEGFLALSLASVIIEEGLAEREAARAFSQGLGGQALREFRPEKVQEVTGVAAERIRSLARAFARQRPSLAIAGGPCAGQTNGLFNVSSVLALNYLVGSVGVPGGVIFNPPPPPSYSTVSLPPSPFAAWLRPGEGMGGDGAKPVNMLLIWGPNPVHSLPASSGFLQALEAVPLIVSFASLMDDTAAYSDLVLPILTPLEEWGDDVPEPGPGYQVVGLQQPVVYPASGAKSFPDLLLGLGKSVGPDLAQALPWPSYKEALQDSVRQLHASHPGEARPEDFATFWNELLQKGGWWDEKVRGGPANALPPAFRGPALPSFAGEIGEYPYHFIPFPSHSLGDGRGAALPWLQATPDPLTTVTWETWVEMNAASARQLGFAEGDILAVESPYGRVEAPLYPHPLLPPGVVRMPLGQGHKSADRYSTGHGSNPLALLAPLTDSQTGALAWAATRVRLTSTGRRLRLTKFEGVVPAVELPGAQLIRVTKD